MLDSIRSGAKRVPGAVWLVRMNAVIANSTLHGTRHADASSLIDMTVDGQDRQMLNLSAAEYCRDRFQIWMS